jgi:hypothetical protein
MTVPGCGDQMMKKLEAVRVGVLVNTAISIAS